MSSLHLSVSPPDLEGEALQIKLPGFAGGDRTSLDLPLDQQKLLSSLHALHKPMVVVLTSGSAVSLDANQIGASALLAAWYSGEEGGHALANILSGRTNPSGRLPVTFYRSVSQLPAFTDYSMKQRTYRYFDGPALYPFGFGLSYAHFVYGQVHLSSHTVHAGDTLTATVSLHNTSNIAGDEVAELYLLPPQVQGSPHLALRGIERINLHAGESRQLTFSLDPQQMSFVDPDGNRAVRAGDYRLFIGGAQPNPAQDKFVVFKINGEKSLNY